MGENKGKALALDLMDDLLNEDHDLVVELDKTKLSESSVDLAPAEPVDDSLSHSDDFDSSDKTAPIVSTLEATVAESTIPTRESVEMPAPAHESEDRVRASVGRFAPFRASSSGSATEASLSQSETLRIAQNRLLELEKEIERLRLQNEELAAAGETLRRRADETTAKNQRRERDYESALESFELEKTILTDAKESMQKELDQQRHRVEELELRISSNIQKIRVRERELENRLELVKMEGQAIVRSKDEMILDLKRTVDQLNLELSNYRGKNQELNRQVNDKQEMLRRTVKALRLALSMLEGDEEASGAPQQRKAK